WTRGYSSSSSRRGVGGGGASPLGDSGVTCTRCQAENPEGTRFCGQCAAPLGALCPQCGAANPAGNRFCGQWAASLYRSFQPRMAAPESYTPKHLDGGSLTSHADL